MSASTGLVLQLTLLIIIAAIWLWTRILKMRMEMRAFVPAERSANCAEERQKTGDSIKHPCNTLAGAGLALAHPPSELQTALTWTQQRRPGVGYTVPLGWVCDPNNGQPWCVSVSLTGDTFHTLITGQSRIGKDNLALNAMLALALNNAPEQVQFCIIDGKGLDFVGFEGKAHTWMLALKPTEIEATMQALSQERERRGDMLRAARVSKWENYKGKLPLLVVYVSELSLLEDAVGSKILTNWLNSELAAGAAFGIRYIVATQTASNFATRWRSQISLYLAGFQPSQSQDQPNTGLTTKEITMAGGVPPSDLQPHPSGAGVFTLVQGREAITLRAGLLDDEQRNNILNALPDGSREHTYTPSNSDHQDETPTICTLSTSPQNRIIALPNDEYGLSDDEIQQLLNQGIGKTEIAMKLRGTMQKRLARVEAVINRTG